MKLKDYLIYFWFDVVLKRGYPCGRTKKDKHLCCKRPINSKTCYLSEDKTKAYCLYCGSCRANGNAKIDLDHPWDDLWE